MTEADPWRDQVLELLLSMQEPVAMLLLLAAFSLGLFTVRAMA